MPNIYLNLPVGTVFSNMAVGTGYLFDLNYAAFEFQVNAGDNLSININHPACLGPSSWDLIVECFDEEPEFNSNPVYSFRSYEKFDENSKPSPSIIGTYNVTYFGSEPFKIIYTNENNDEITLSSNDKWTGISPVFCALKGSVQVKGDIQKYSINAMSEICNGREIVTFEKENIENTIFSGTTITHAHIKKPNFINPFNLEKGQTSNRSSSPCSLLSYTNIPDLNYPGYTTLASALGSSLSTNADFGGSLGIGIGCNPILKGAKITIDLGLGGSWENSESLVANADMNGDGYPDIVRKVGNVIKYYPHKVERIPGTNGDDIIHTFAQTGINLLNIPTNEFYSSNSSSISYNIGLTISTTSGVVGGHGGINRSSSSSVTDIYITDGNGDQLPDISINGYIFFNTLDRETGEPSFSLSSEPTENLIVVGSSIEKTEPDNFENIELEFPSYDVVKVWEAIHDGEIIIDNGSVSANAKISIETDNNGIYGLNGIVNAVGTCRLYHGDNGSNLVINALPTSGELICQGVGVDPCDLDSDGDGINDCLDCINTSPGTFLGYTPEPDDLNSQIGCENCASVLTITDPVLNGQTEIKEASNWVEARNIINSTGEAFYHAGNYVELNAASGLNFNVLLGGQLSAYIESCNSNTSSGGTTPTNNSGESSTLRVKKGQKIYFRLHVNKDVANEEVGWNPEVRYTSISGAEIDNNEVDPDGIHPHKSKYSDGFLLNKKAITILNGGSASGSKATISWTPFQIGGYTDEVIFRIKKFDDISQDFETGGSILWEYVVPINSPITMISNSPINVYLTNSTPIGLKFEVFSTSNIDWQGIQWHPVVNTVIKDNLPGGTIRETPNVQVPIVNYTNYKYFTGNFAATNGTRWKSYNNVNAAFDIGKTYYIRPAILNSIAGHLNRANCNSPELCGNSTLYFVVKQNNKVIGRRTITVNGSLNAPFTIPFLTYNTNSAIPVNITDDASKIIHIELVGDGSYWSDELLRILDNPQLNLNYFYPIATLSQNANGSNGRQITRRNVAFLHLLRDATGHYYRGWGQFLYDQDQDEGIDMAEDDSAGIKLLNIGKLVQPLPTPEDVTSLDDMFDAENGSFEGFDPEKAFDVENLTIKPESVDNPLGNLSSIQLPKRLFYFMLPEKSNVETEYGSNIREIWHGMSKNNFSAKYSARALSMLEALQFQTGYESYELNFDGQNTGARSVNKRVISKTTAVTYGVSVAPFNVGKNKTLSSSSKNLSDYFDINGDSYPDILFNNFAQVTNATGGLYPSSFDVPGPDPSEAPTGNRSWGDNIGSNSIATDGVSIGASASGAYGKAGEPTGSTSGQGGIKSSKFLNFVKGHASTGISGNFSSSNSTTKVLWTDINGDGLSDRLEYDGAAVKSRLNLGVLGLDDVDENIYPFISMGNNTNSSAGGGIGITWGKGNSISAGYSAGIGSSDTDGQLIDINGDGLLDYYGQLSAFPGVYFIKYNYGNGFYFDAGTFCNPNFNLIRNAESTNSSLNFSGTYGLPIPFFFTCFKVFNLNLNAVILSKSQNLTKKSIEDYDGDGYPDFVQQYDDGKLTVRHSKIGRTNKLKSIKTPFGAEYTVDYKVSQPTYDMPNGKYVMSETKVTDLYATANEGVPTVTKRYAYHNGRYDRRERDFYGYEYVRTMDVEGENLYRQNIVKYNNSSYYLNGVVLENIIVKGSNGVTITPAANSLQKDVIEVANSGIFTKTINQYEVRLPEIANTPWTMGGTPPDGNDYDIGGTKGHGAAFAVQTQGTTQIHELGTGIVEQTQSFTYDPFNRVTSVTYAGSGNAYTTNILYFPNYSVADVLTIPHQIEVISGNAVRKRVVPLSGGINPETGDILKIHVYYTASQYNETSMTYYTNGNLHTITYPQDQDGMPLVRTYLYDVDVSQFVTNVSDNFLFQSSSTYDPKYGNMLTATDITGSIMSYTYDAKGRNTSIKGPKDPNYTINMSYTVNSSGKSYATTEHYDQDNPGDPIKTITIVNGLGEPVQVKKDVEIYTSSGYTDGMSVSGNVTKDAFGRALVQFHPAFEAGAGSTSYVVTNTLTASSTYDELDRVKTATDAAGTTITNTYAVDNGALKTTTSIPQSGGVTMVNESYQDLDKRIIRKVNNGKAVDFLFDGIGQLLTVTDEDGNTTESEYDVAGRRTKWTHPDAGESNYTFDDLGRMKTMTTANGSLIEYKYDALGRPKEIKYPDLGGAENVNNVLYEYYPATGAALNNGRLKHQEDGAGIQKFEYGNMGEVVKKTRTIFVPGQSSHTFVEEFAYDSWNRIQSMTYPGGEVLSYAYDKGGNLKTMSSSSGGNYITEIGYDHYEQKVYCHLGNGTKNNYTYTPELRRLQNMQAKTAGGTNMFNNTYTFDLVGNVKSIQNAAGAVGLMGGVYQHNYTYDIYNRLHTANGTWTGVQSGQIPGNNHSANYTTTMDYQGMHRITSKNQTHNRDGAPVGDNTYNNVYTYGNATHPNAVMSIADGANSHTFTYDANGNMLTHANSQGDDKTMLWDEENMLKAINVANASLQHNIYDAGGDRVLKGEGTITTVVLNGLPTTSATVGNYVVYASEYLVVGANGMVTKHYYNGSDRVLSRLSGAVSGYNNYAPISGSQTGTLAARQLADLQLVFDYYTLGTASIVNQIPSLTDCEVNNDCGSVLYYFHPDHVGSSTFLSDGNGLPYQFLLYLPFGESMAEQKAGGFGNRYKFNGKEQDALSGLYYYGARFYDPVVSIWLEVDPEMEKYPGLTPYNFALNNPIVLVDPDGNSPISMFVKAAAKLGIKKAGKDFIQKQIKARLKNYSSSAWGKQLLGDALSFVDIATSTSWVDLAIEFIPVVGDAYGAGKLGKQGYQMWKGLEKFEKIASIGSKAASAAWKKLGVQKIGGKMGDELNAVADKLNNQGTHLNENDLGGYVKEIFGLSSNGQHMKEASEALGGMGKKLDKFKNEIKAGKYGTEGKSYEAAQGLLNAAQKQYDDIINVINSAKKQAIE
ncbi:MAG TPA: RHS repeat-associated core domain-containing protein [Saprospiraceae bacterium]|nr:RHS repeat-associated core domain-containing protein [Saprospiraceae bacterium]